MAILVHGQDPLIVDLSADVTAMDAVVDNIHNVDLPAVQSDVDALQISVANIASDIITLTTMVSGLSLDRAQIFQMDLKEAANIGDVTLATVNGSVQIESVIVKTNSFHADLTSIAVTGGASKVIEFISAASGAAANLNAEDKQVSWTGAVELKDGKTIVITFAGTGGHNVNMTATIKYRAVSGTGSLT